MSVHSSPPIMEVLLQAESNEVMESSSMVTKEESNEDNGPGENCGELGDFISVSVIHSRLPLETIPKPGMQFDTEEEAWQFYVTYAKQVGFGVRRQRSYNDKHGRLIDRIFCCCAEGRRKRDKRDAYVKVHRPETRFGCLARMRVNSRHSKKFRVIDFVAEHTHCLSSPDETHMFRSHRSISSSQTVEVEMVNVTPTAGNELIVREVSGQEYMALIPDYHNYLRSKRTRDVKPGEIRGILGYINKMQVEDPHFFYAVQVDEDDVVTSIFWSDTKMRADYNYFGDVVCFDTSHRRHEGRPIALFVGVNHHKQPIVFGAALLYDETALSFEWLFDTFSRAMSGAKPKTILTDQDAAMTEILALRWPETHHRLCVWHIYQNAVKHLSTVFAKFKSFSDDFGRCIYDFEDEEDFLTAWNSMLDAYGLQDNVWLKQLFELREKWAPVYGRFNFCADITTTQGSESMKSILKRHVSYKDNIFEFLNYFEKLIDDLRYNELKADLKENVSVPSLQYPCELLKHAASVYTAEVLAWFQSEWCKSIDASFVECGEMGAARKYEITPYKKNYHHIVLHDTVANTFHCSCKIYEFCGILCSHVLKVFNLRNVLRIPDQYIMKRWTRGAKTEHLRVDDAVVNRIDMDHKVLYRLRCKDLCHLYVQLATKAAVTEETYVTTRNGLIQMLDTMDAGLQRRAAKVQHSHLRKL